MLSSEQAGIFGMVPGCPALPHAEFLAAEPAPFDPVLAPGARVRAQQLLPALRQISLL